ncbi:hypothetical protein F2Q69_00063219 [Brassica cretica]|uniref:DC-UbP/UBTD2 N-terminal domain-containing protein n=2 Tax=Brassica cretica TaxID=69181 RepID=A0A8S9RH80_BRACR|nr:hypothetical protein F2Q69_00063219 [Brassica cretica]
MGCSSSRTMTEGRKEKIRRPKTWKHPQPISRAELTQMGEEFWDTAPHYGGKKEIWDALRAAAEEDDLSLAQTVIESAGVVVQNADLTICFFFLGSKYKLPKYVLRDPSNLITTK